MKVLPDQIQNIQPPQNQKGPEALRQAAMQFEALLLLQLTSALNNTSGGDEEALFGSDGGSGLAKQMFSEQLATTMAQSGGVGIADIILNQVDAGNAKHPTGGIKGLADVISTVKGLRENSGNANSLTRVGGSTTGGNDLSSRGGVEIISTAEDDLKTGGLDDSLKNLLLNGKVVNSTRARIVPDAPVVLTLGLPASPTAAATHKVDFQLPVNGRVSSDFGNRFHPIDRKIKFHDGIDIAVAKGTSVAAASDGIVTFAGWKGGYGNLVIITHPDGRETRYGHLSKISIVEGENVTGGQQIALSGSTGRSTGPHVHFEVRENGQVVNPLRIMSNVFLNDAER